MGDSDRYKVIADHYEKCLEVHGDTHLGVDWPREEDLTIRYQVMIDLVREDREATVDLLDFGCGTSHLYTFLRQNGYMNVRYAGLDISEKFVEISRAKFPENEYFCIDVLNPSEKLPEFDYVLMNGVFTQKRELGFEEMFDFMKNVLRALKPSVRKGIAFNVMSGHVDWKRDAAFHVPFDRLAELVIEEYGRNFVFRHDYGLYEYTVYIYKSEIKT